MSFSKNIRTVARIFAALVLVNGAARSVYAAEQTQSRTVCPSNDFQVFFNEFSKSLDAQQTFAAAQIKLTQLSASHDGVAPDSKLVPVSDLVLPVVSPISTGQSAVEITVGDGKAQVVDKRAGLDAIKIYSFSSGTCWALVGVEDWSVKEKDLHLVQKPGMTAAQDACLAKGAIFAKLAGPEQYPLTQEFYEAAEQSYVCAAASGDPEASYAAASLSMSQMAPFLGFSQTEKLYEAAAQKIPEAALTLSNFYCDGGDSSAPEGPCQYPVKAKEALIQAAKLGSADALNALGESFEKGRLNPADIHKAYACYEEAAAKGNDEAKAALDRLAPVAAVSSSTTNCY